MKIVAATLRDVPALVGLMTASPLLRRYGVGVVSARRSLLEGLRGSDVLLVAVDAGQIIGMAWLITSRALDRSAYLRLLLVAEEQHSRGVGAALLEAAERRARSRRCRHVVLLVTATNRRARTFYEGHGYRRVGILPDFVRRGIREALYGKTLATSDAGRRSRASRGRARPSVR